MKSFLDVSAAIAMHQFLAFLFLVLAASVDASKPCYDHQTETYRSKFSPVGCQESCTVTPFFSPDHSIDAYLETIESAQESIDLMEPGKPVRAK